MNQLLMTWFYTFTGILVFVTVSLFYRLYGKGKKKHSKLTSEELLILPFCFKACLLMSIGMIILIMQMHTFFPYRSSSAAYVLLGFATILLFIGLLFLIKYFSSKPKKTERK